MPTMRAVVTIASPYLGGTGTNTWHYRTTGSGPGGEIEAALLNGYLEDWYTAMRPWTPSSTTFAFDGVGMGVGANEGEFQSLEPWSMAGTATDAALPPANAVCINWRGLSGDRSRRGRTFFGPCSHALLHTDGTLATASLAAVRDAAAALVSASLEDANGAWGIWSRQEAVLRDFAASSVRDQFAVLRSRRD